MKQVKLTKGLANLLCEYESIANKIEYWESVLPGCTCGCGGDAYPGGDYMDELNTRLDSCHNTLLKHGVYADFQPHDQPEQLLDGTIRYQLDDGTTPVSYDELNTLVDGLDWAVRAWLATGEDNSHNVSSVTKTLNDSGVVGVYEYLIEEYSNIDGVDNKNFIDWLNTNLKES